MGVAVFDSDIEEIFDEDMTGAFDIEGQEVLAIPGQIYTATSDFDGTVRQNWSFVYMASALPELLPRQGITVNGVAWEVETSQSQNNITELTISRRVA